MDVWMDGGDEEGLRLGKIEGKDGWMEEWRDEGRDG